VYAEESKSLNEAEQMVKKALEKSAAFEKSATLRKELLDQQGQKNGRDNNVGANEKQ